MSGRENTDPSVITVGRHKVSTVVISEVDVLKDVLDHFLTFIGSISSVKNVVGMCTELTYISNPDETKTVKSNKVALLQLCHGGLCLIIQLLQFDKIPDCLYNFVALPRITFVGIGIKDEVARLGNDYGLQCRNVVDLGPLAASVRARPCLAAYGLADLFRMVECESYKIPDGIITDSWSKVELSKMQIYKVASDAFVSFAIGIKLLGGLF